MKFPVKGKEGEGDAKGKKKGERKGAIYALVLKNNVLQKIVVF